MPSNETIKSLSVALDAYYKKRIGNISENQTLTKLRDTLLPKLISGELRIEDAEKVKQIEKTTNHDVKAVEYYIKQAMDDLGLGSYKEFIQDMWNFSGTGWK